jgi:hypothetical protein
VTTRKMWAPKGWERAESALFFSYRDAWREGEEVEVTKVDHVRPDFKPGDRVEARHSPNGVFRVVDVPVQVAGVWYVPVVLDRESDVAHPMLRVPANLTKLPREKTVTLRVTGPEDAVEDFISAAETSCNYEKPRVVTVERVEAER